MEWLIDPTLWIALLQIVVIDILLGGDNAVVIALACRKLPVEQRRKAILGGVAGAIVLRIVLLFFAINLLDLPYLKLIGAVLLLWIGVKLLMPEEEDAGERIDGGTRLITAIKTIIVADAVMSLDNVIAVAGAAGGNLYLVSLGVLISIPIIVWGSQLVLKLMDRFPVVITFGGALLGWIAGGMAVSDHAVQPWLANTPGWLHYAASAIGALLVIVAGLALAKRRVKAA